MLQKPLPVHGRQLVGPTSGTGTTAHIAAELLAHDARIKLIHVPYKGGRAADRGPAAGL